MPPFSANLDSNAAAKPALHNHDEDPDNGMEMKSADRLRFTNEEDQPLSFASHMVSDVTKKVSSLLSTLKYAALRLYIVFWRKSISSRLPSFLTFNGLGSERMTYTSHI